MMMPMATNPGADRIVADLKALVDVFGASQVRLACFDPDVRGKIWERICAAANAFHWATSMSQRNTHNHWGCYVTPIGEHAMVLVDDLDMPAIELMKADGFRPAATVQTSWDSYQVWIKLSLQPVPPEVRFAVASYLAFKYGGDQKCLGNNHLGRTARHVNYKVKHFRPANSEKQQHPWTRLVSATGEVAPAAAKLMAELATLVAAPVGRRTSLDFGSGAQWDSSPPLPGRLDAELDEVYPRLVAGRAGSCVDSLTGRADRSLVDWRVCIDLLKTGDYGRVALKAAVVQHSLKAGHHKNVRWDAFYAHVTVENAWVSRVVVAARKNARVGSALDRRVLA